jgi:hypothetical protein
MTPRKQTPDVLSEVLGGEPTPAPAQPPDARPPTAARPRPAPAAASRPAPARKATWEYLEVVFHDYRGYRPRFVNGQEQPRWKKLPVMRDYLNQLGEQGWELAALGSRVNLEMPAYFKRPG